MFPICYNFFFAKFCDVFTYAVEFFARAHKKENYNVNYVDYSPINLMWLEKNNE